MDRSSDTASGRWKVHLRGEKGPGWDHFECRGWGCVHRHFIVTIVSQLFCAGVRHRYCKSEVVTNTERLTLEQVRRASDVFIRSIELSQTKGTSPV